MKGFNFPLKAWAIVNRQTQKMEIFDARCPVYWLQSVARAAANERGYTTHGTKSDVEIKRVKLAKL